MTKFKKLDKIETGLKRFDFYLKLKWFGEYFI